jgi:hypothetical protein
MTFQLLGGFSAQEVDEVFAPFDRGHCGRIAGLRRGLGRLGPDRLLIMSSSDRAVRAILTLVCLVAIVPMTIAALAQITRLEALSACRRRQRALTRSFRWLV